MGSRKRRSWSDEEKRSICHQTTAPGVSVAQVARRYAMNGNQIFNWLKDERFAPGVDVAEIEDGVFLPVAVSDEPETALTAVQPARHRYEIKMAVLFSGLRFPWQTATGSLPRAVLIWTH